MATRPADIVRDKTGQVLIQWTNITENDTGGVVDISDFTDVIMDFEASGSFGGGSVTLLGGLVAANQNILTTSAGDNATLSAGGLFSIVQSPRFISIPSPTGTGASIDVNVLVRYGRQH